jgi:hypothetical protein
MDPRDIQATIDEISQWETNVLQDSWTKDLRMNGKWSNGSKTGLTMNAGRLIGWDKCFFPACYRHGGSERSVDSVNSFEVLMLTRRRIGQSASGVERSVNFGALIPDSASRRQFVLRHSVPFSRCRFHPSVPKGLFACQVWHYLRAILQQLTLLWPRRARNPRQVTNLGTDPESSNRPLAQDATRSYCLQDQADGAAPCDLPAALREGNLRSRFGSWSGTPQIEYIVYKVSLSKKLLQIQIDSAAASRLRRPDRRRDIHGYKALNVMVHLLKILWDARMVHSLNLFNFMQGRYILIKSGSSWSGKFESIGDKLINRTESFENFDKIRTVH